MPSFPKPLFTYNYQVDIEINNLKNYQNTALGRAIPSKSSNRLLIATWNIANLGLQDRKNNDFQKFLLVNVHLYYGEDSKKDRERRALEAYATSRWADLRQRSKNAYVRDIIVLGDFNLPKVEPGDLIYLALRKRGLRRPLHSTRIYSNLSNDKEYDQIMFFPGHTKQDFTGNMGIFDFDGALFPDLWQTRTAKQFKSFLRYYISDHRILWAEFKI